MTTHDKCPHCGAKWMFDIPPSTRQYACGSCGDSAFTQSNTCSERQAHAATRDRLKEMTEIAEELAEAIKVESALARRQHLGHATIARLEAARKEGGAASDITKCPVCGKDAQRKTYGPFFTPDPTYRMAMTCPDDHWRGPMKEAKP